MLQCWQGKTTRSNEPFAGSLLHALNRSDFKQDVIFYVILFFSMYGFELQVRVASASDRLDARRHANSTLINSNPLDNSMNPLEFPLRGLANPRILLTTTPLSLSRSCVTKICADTNINDRLRLTNKEIEPSTYRQFIDKFTNNL